MAIGMAGRRGRRRRPSSQPSDLYAPSLSLSSMDGITASQSSQASAATCSVALSTSVVGDDAANKDNDDNDMLPVPLTKPSLHAAAFVSTQVESSSSTARPRVDFGPKELHSDSLSYLYGTEHHLVGLSPQFWAHTPMTIHDVLSLGLINGVDSIMSPPRYDYESHQQHSQSSSGRKRKRTPSTSIDHIVPVSRCELVGIIVNVERRAGSTLYLLDDGTGLIDCVAWEDSGGGVYSLPPLVDTVPHNNNGSDSNFRVGDFVRIRGKIHCISVGAETRTIDVAPVAGNSAETIGNGRRHEIPITVVREITVATIERTLEWKSNGGLNGDVVHWLKAIKFGKRVGLRRNANGRCDDANDSDKMAQPEQDIQNENHELNRQELLEPIRNGADVLDLLGEDIVSRVTQMDRTVVADDDYGAWRLFGPDCSCRLAHKYDLLYCHCLAMSEPLDPRQKFRDALLAHLLTMENKEPMNPLKFQYGQLLNDKSLFSVATTTVAATSNPAANARRLFINTFRALRDDGIIHLDDQESDTYLLISRTGVLEPYVRQLLDKESSTLERSLLRPNPPPYLNRVPAQRIRVTMKSLVTNAKQQHRDDTS